MSKNTALKDDNDLGNMDKKDIIIAEMKINSEEKLVNLISKILINKVIKEVNEKGYTLFKIQQ
ncbi:hypothetical protein [Sphingobacterium sp. DR205]|uniref:hypothetical protein n=1 Tax=Sphingobacterium sp. DR205 TaxID=2713573 RepID=UPI0013E42E54|nr:hypothetical protein [Sphingobacterium sp. DR205]QIH35862.1 hypothetical protein G6053_24640 [Sphingobacterium sp. DR205]